MSTAAAGAPRRWRCCWRGRPRCRAACCCCDGERAAVSAARRCFVTVFVVVLVEWRGCVCVEAQSGGRRPARNNDKQPHLGAAAGRARRRYHELALQRRVASRIASCCCCCCEGARLRHLARNKSLCRALLSPDANPRRASKDIQSMPKIRGLVGGVERRFAGAGCRGPRFKSESAPQEAQKPSDKTAQPANPSHTEQQN